MKIFLLQICLFLPLALLAQKDMLQYDLYSPDTVSYDIKIMKDKAGLKMVFADLGTFNSNNEPAVSFYASPRDHAFILDNCPWNAACLKPIYDKRYAILPGKTGKILSLQYLSKYSKFFASPFKQTTIAHTTHGNISFEIRGCYLPAYIHIDTPSFYNASAMTGHPISDTFSVKNTGKQTLLIHFVKYDVDLQNQDTTAISIPVGKTKKIMLSYTPNRKGLFSRSAEMVFNVSGDKVKHTAILKIRGWAY
jgi:hypothetical protein